MKGFDIKKGKKEAEEESEIDFLIVELLTNREIEVLQLAGKGYSNNEIASELHISVNTVKRHLNNAFTKLGVSTRTQAIRVAQQQGFINWPKPQQFKINTKIALLFQDNYS